MGFRRIEGVFRDLRGIMKGVSTFCRTGRPLLVLFPLRFTVLIVRGFVKGGPAPKPWISS